MYESFLKFILHFLIHKNSLYTCVSIHMCTYVYVYMSMFMCNWYEYYNYKPICIFIARIYFIRLMCVIIILLLYGLNKQHWINFFRGWLKNRNEYLWDFFLFVSEHSFVYFCCSTLSHVWLSVTSRTVAHQACLSLRFTRQEYWSGLPFPPPGDLSDSQIETASRIPPALAGRFSSITTTWEAQFVYWNY